MGWFTKQTTKWELKQSWLSILGICIPIGIPFISMIYMGIRAKIKPLLYAGFLYAVVFSIIVLMYIFIWIGLPNNLGLILVLILNYLLGPIVISIYLQRFLTRVDLSSIIHLKWSEQYDYIDFMRRKEISEVLSVASFVTSLQNWQEIINNQQVKKCIENMIGLTKEITHNNKHVSNLFIERHAYSIENILQQYMQIERAKIKNQIMVTAEEKLRNTIILASKAFEEELKNQRNFRNFEIQVQADTYMNDLKNKGLL
ncbi:hypothetical protein [Myroides sp. LJL119]